MSKSYRSFEPKQKYLLPPSPEDWLPEGHLVYFVQDVVLELDLGAFFAFYELDHRGAPPYHPAMMVASVDRRKPAKRGHLKTGQRAEAETRVHLPC